MVHIRLDEETHRKLKLYAVVNDTTIQSVVGDLIHDKLTTRRKPTKRESPERGGK